MHLKSRFAASLAFSLVAATPLLAFGQATPRNDAAAIDFFEKKVRPLLAENCYNCHSAETNSKGGLRVDDRNGLLVGGSGGAAVVPGDPEQSLLIKAVRYADEDLKMPPKKRLSAEQVADLTKWIQDGAAWPEVAATTVIGKPDAKYEKLKREHWAWQPLGSGAPPQISSDWARDDIDRFVAAKLREKGLQPVGDADTATLLRRITFDLTGLPPAPEEIDAFVAQSSPDAFEEVVDRLLASPAYGERWGRHWLDVARYGESTGSSRNVPYPHAWRYRDYVIDAFNHDKPYDQFIREQIAGDLLPAATPRQRDEQQIATGFLAIGVKDVNQRFKVRFIMDNIDEQIDTVSRSVLALTASCARCHDHKFDPIPTTDYYALAGIFNSSDLCAGVRNKMGGGGLDYYDTQMLLVLGPPKAADPELDKKLAEAKAKVAEARKAFEKLRDSPEGAERAPNGRPKRAMARQKMNRLQTELAALTDPAANGAKTAFGVREAKTVGDTQIRFRGEAEKLGPSVPRGFLDLVKFPGQPVVNPAQSGRLELAQWLTSPSNPLTSRVIANRVWQHLFGDGLVKSVDNFGVTGDTPSHPELLDHLAQRLIQHGWSVKQLVRSIVLSRAYQLGSDAPESNTAIDPANRLVWRHSPRRLDAEEIRDAALVIAGKLDAARPEGSPAKDLKVIELRNNGPEARRLEEQTLTSAHRSVYLPLLRGLTPNSLEVFDFAEQGMVTGSRETTTVAPQALYLLNDPFVRRQSLALADRLLLRTDLDDSARIHLAYRLLLGRTATTPEIERVKGYLADYESAARQVAVSTQAAALESKPNAHGDGAAAAPAGSAPRSSEAGTNAVATATAPAGSSKDKASPVQQDASKTGGPDAPKPVEQSVAAPKTVPPSTPIRSCRWRPRSKRSSYRKQIQRQRRGRASARRC